MRGECNQSPCEIDAWAEALAVLALAGVVNGRTRARVYRSLRDIDPARVDAATASLLAAGVVNYERGRIVQSKALQRLDRPDLICI